MLTNIVLFVVMLSVTRWQLGGILITAISQGDDTACIRPSDPASVLCPQHGRCATRTRTTVLSLHD